MNQHPSIATSLSTAIEGVAGNPVRTPSPLDLVLQEAGKRLASLRMTRLTHEPISGDAESAIADLESVAAIFDGVLAEMGAHYASHFGFSQTQAERNFNDQVWQALEGNATFLIEEAYRDYVEDKMSRGRA